MPHIKSQLGSAVLTSVLLLSASASAQADVALSGFLTSSSPSSFSIADLQSYAASHTTSSVTVNGDTYTGVSLYGYLNSYRATDPAAKNDVLRDYVVANGSNGSTVYALGNLLGSSFGTQNDIIAYSDSNGSLAAPSLVAADGSLVSNLNSVNLGHVAYQGLGAGGVSTSISLGGDVSSPATYTAANLPGSLTVHTVYNLVAGGSAGFTGVSLWDLLVSAGITTDPAALLRSYVIATGTDNYTSVYSLEEILPQYGNQADLVAYLDGLGSSLGSNGFARTVVPGDLKGGRFMSNLNSLTVVTAPAAVPVPPAAIMMLSGLLFSFAFNGSRKPLAA